MGEMEGGFLWNWIPSFLELIAECYSVSVCQQHSEARIRGAGSSSEENSFEGPVT